MIGHDDLGSIAAEFGGLSLPDKRFGKNIQKMAIQLADHPGLLFQPPAGKPPRSA